MMRAMVPSAYLRVFQSLEALPDAERERWERYIVVGDGSAARAAKRYRQVPAGPRTPYPFLEAIEEDHADVRREDGRLYVCPRRSHLQALASMVAPREQPGERTRASRWCPTWTRAAPPASSPGSAARTRRSFPRWRRAPGTSPCAGSCCSTTPSGGCRSCRRASG